MGIGMLLKPMLLINGVHELRIRFDSEQRVIVATGTQYGQAFEYRQSFEELEALINGPGPTAEEREAGGVLPEHRTGGDRTT